MNYEIVNLESKTVVAITAVTNNAAADMPMVIGSVWKRFLEPAVYDAVEGKINERVLGIYTDYQSDETDDYRFLAGCEIVADQLGKLPGGMVLRMFPAGKFARFTIYGDPQKVVGRFWQQLWTLNLDRTFQYDFEEYQTADMAETQIQIYIGIK